MAEYTPNTDEMRENYARSLLWPAQADPARAAYFDRWLAAHDAEVRAGAVAEEPEWEVEYGVRGDVDSPMPSREAAEHAIERMAKAPRGYRLTRSLVERRVSPWVPVKQEGAPSDA